jgi:OmpA family protein
LRCPEAAERERQIESGESEVRQPDVYYTDSSLEKKQVYLDYFADQLQKSPADSTVYIIGYAGRRARVGEAQARARLAKNYLTRRRGLEPGRFVIVNGGHRDPAGVELFIIRRGQPKPLAHPDIYPGDVHVLTKARR